MIPDRIDVSRLAFLLLTTISFLLPVSFIADQALYWWSDIRVLFLVLIAIAGVSFSRVGSLPERVNVGLTVFAFLFAASAPVFLLEGEMVQGKGFERCSH